MPIIDQVLSGVVASSSTAEPAGSIDRILRAYDAATSPRLLGFLLDVDYDTMQLVTCDAWKRNCGGLPRNSLVLIKLNERLAGFPPRSLQPSLILARIIETAPTPVKSDIQSTIFQIHKVQAQVDALTSAELQWGALKARVLGTYFDYPDGTLGFGNDVDTFSSPHFYEVYAPTREHSEILINSFVDASDPIRIGRLRYTETETRAVDEVEVRVSPGDFITNRTALFGKTRMGKSNTIKVILDTMLRSPAHVGQVVFDLSGEYTYPDKQTGASLFLEHRANCTRYSMNPRTVELERQEAVAPPRVLRANFFEQVSLGHSILATLYPATENRVPDYIAPVLAWEPVDRRDIAARFPDPGERTRYERALSLYFCVLRKAGFMAPVALRVSLENLSRAIKVALASHPQLAGVGVRITNPDGDEELQGLQSIDAALRIFEVLFALQADAANTALFPVSRGSGKPYFEPIHVALLRMLGDTGISGALKFTPFRAYHDATGTDIVADIIADVDGGKTVFIDLASADLLVTEHYSTLLTRAVLNHQMRLFAEQDANEFADRSVLFYFEEAHNLFRADDRDLKSVYNKLAKEGAKFRIGMVYATQSMTTLSPDLLKNTENFFIAHLNDDREIKEIERRYEFDGIGLDVQRARSKGYVRMITLSHRYALPVQIKLFALGAGTAARVPTAVVGEA